MEMRDIRISRLRMQIIRYRTAREFCDAYGLDTSFVNQLINKHCSFGEKVAWRLEVVIGLPAGWLDREPHPLDDYKDAFDNAPQEVQGMIMNFLEAARTQYDKGKTTSGPEPSETEGA